MRGNAGQCGAMRGNAGQCRAMRGNAGQCEAMRGNAGQCSRAKKEKENFNTQHKTKWQIQQHNTTKAIPRSQKICRLPAPPLTRSMGESINESEKRLADDYPTDEFTAHDVTFWDSFMYCRYHPVTRK